MRAMLASLEWPGHLFPLIALGKEFRARRHEVIVDTSERWRDVVETQGLRFAPAVEYDFEGGAADGFGPKLAPAARARAPLMAEFAPDVVVTDLLAPAPALAAEAAGVPRCVLIPHLFPVGERSFSGSRQGLMLPRTPVGRIAWKAAWPVMAMRLRKLRRHLDGVRAELGLPPLADFNAAAGGLTLIGTLPQLEYPRQWPSSIQVTGPLRFDPPHRDIDLPPGDDPLVVVASSTESAHDPELRMPRAALEALAGEPVRVVASTGGRLRSWDGPVPDNAVVVDWLSYGQVIPRASLVVCNGGHGTVVRALAEGVPVLVCPAGADMAENGVRVAWTGAGLALPSRLLGAGAVRCAVRRVLGDRRFTARALELAAWCRDNDGAVRAADLVEAHAGGE